MRCFLWVGIQVMMMIVGENIIEFEGESLAGEALEWISFFVALLDKFSYIFNRDLRARVSHAWMLRLGIVNSE